MKRYKNLYPEICSFENLLLASQKAQRGKRAICQVAEFNHRLEYELFALQKELEEQTYQPGAYRTFTINDPKTRLISAAPYRDRVVHHALCNVVEPIIERTFIHDSYACRKGKGTHAAADRFTYYARRYPYALKCDIRKYFPNIDHEILKSLLRRKIACPKTLWLLDAIIDGSNPQPVSNDYFPGDDLFTPSERRKGLPIGNQTSQFFANVYLNPLDHLIKEALGCKAYIRYVDDFVVFGEDKSALWKIRDTVALFLTQTLRLYLHSGKQNVFPVSSGNDFLGYYIYPAYRRVRATSGWRFARNLRQMAEDFRRGLVTLPKVQQRIMSWFGHANHADTSGLKTALLVNVVFRRA